MLSLFSDAMILSIENPKYSTKKILELKDECSRVAVYKISIKESVVFYSPNELSKSRT